MTKYLNPGLDVIGQGPQTSECTNLKGALTRLLTLAGDLQSTPVLQEEDR